MDVVEIDPGVTQVAYEHLGLKDYEGLNIVHMDGRQFVAEKAEPGTYDLVIQDAVNDLSVPSHLLTKEYNDAVKRRSSPDGVYLLTVIDSLDVRAAVEGGDAHPAGDVPADNVCLLRGGEPARRRDSVQASVRDLRLRPRRSTWTRSGRRCRTGSRTNGDSPRADGQGRGRRRGSRGPPGGSHHALAAVAAVDSMFESRRYRTVRLLHAPHPGRDRLRPYLEAGKKIILTDQFAPWTT